MPMTRSIVTLPAEAGGSFQIYVNGVPQQAGVDFRVDGRRVVFERPLRKDRVSGWRWFLGAWGISTYRQDDTVDVRYEREGQTHLLHDLPVELVDGGLEGGS